MTIIQVVRRRTKRAADGGYAARFLSISVALGFSRFDGESTLPPTAANASRSAAKPAATCGCQMRSGSLQIQISATVAARVSASPMLITRRARSSEINRLRAEPPAAQADAVRMITVIIVPATRALPSGQGSVGGRKVVIAAKAKNQAFGFTYWKATAWKRLSGRAN
jgi:hypothetical protein